MDITKETRLADLFAAYPWLKDEMTKISDKFKLLNSPLGKVMLKKATISEMSKKSGMDTDVIIEKLNGMIAEHE
ncbi:MAG: DUF1858 domain-containing protein [Lachnospiraceae bacterium]|nr:DUF1858 domain-containing protein [Lachnospiraceae bacterium]